MNYIPGKWYVSDVLDDGHNGIVNESNQIIIGAASPLTKAQAQKICDAHNSDRLLNKH